MCVGLGALVGGVAGYLLLTDRGRDFRANVEPRVDDLLGEVQRLGAAFDRTRRAVEDGWRSFNRLMEEQEHVEPWRAGRR